MIEVTPFEQHFATELPWLSARHHFSFGPHFDPARTQFGPLRVWNDDRIAPGKGFPRHPHNDMEIITYVRSGAITHQDSLGHRGRTEAGDVQVMSDGSGIFHSEMNEEDEATELFQIWLLPSRTGVTPRWDQRAFPKNAKDGRLTALASGRPGMTDVMTIHQDATLFAAAIEDGQVLEHCLEYGRGAYLVLSRGSLEANGIAIPTRAGVAISAEKQITLKGRGSAEFLLLDLPLSP